MKIPTTSEISIWIKKRYGLDVQTKKLAGEVDLNYYLKSTGGQEYILKIAAADSKQEHLLMQSAMIEHLTQKQGDLSTPRLIVDLEGQKLGNFVLDDQAQRSVRLLTWVSGALWADFSPHHPELLKSLGEICGTFSKHLEGFDHPAAHRWFKWDVQQAAWTEKDFSFIQDSKQKLQAKYFLKLFQEKVLPHSDQLRKSIIHNDANDYNILIDQESEKVISLIDFGDAIYSFTVNELAIAISYGAMGKADPIEAACQIIEGYHKIYPLQEKELAALFALICARLLISVTCSARNKLEHPENEYLLISEKPAWDLLDKFHQLSPDFVHYRFRAACGWEACPQHESFKNWVQDQSFAPLFDLDIHKHPKHILDLSVGSLELGNNSEFDSTYAFDQKVKNILAHAGTELAIGKYAEYRPVYTTDAYEVIGNEGPIWRTLHIGLDVFLPPFTEINAPLDGIVHSFQNNEAERDYGPTIILEHQMEGKEVFYTLYGHLSLDSLDGVFIGQKISKGEKFCKIGPVTVNGAWPPHLHFQIMLDILGKKGDFPGVAFPHEARSWLSFCPDPQLITGRLYEEKTHPSKEELVEARKEKLGKNLSLSYHKPLHMKRAYLQYLFDHQGRRYLDTVNNVPHVGHQHPRVVRAAQQQMAVINTNTRYLHEEIIAFAEELCATFPDPLSVAFFVNSGSEANELALRMARTYTGQKDMLVVDVG
ncbi:MAG: aminotransferase class III-fold pyridoxal phosphate-dependent enzyme, partial [Bacteroidota bacterium]